MFKVKEICFFETKLNWNQKSLGKKIDAVTFDGEKWQQY